MTLKLVVPFAPVAKGRPRFVRATGRAYTPAKTALGEWQIRQAWLQRFGDLSMTGPIRVILDAFVAMPKSIPKRDRATAKPARRPDLDQYVKSALDGLNGVAFADDAQVTDICARKRYGSPPRWEITLEAAPPEVTPREGAMAIDEESAPKESARTGTV